MNTNKQKLFARIMAIVLSALMVGSGLTMIISLLIHFLGA